MGLCAEGYGLGGKHPNEMIDGDRVIHSLLSATSFLKYQVLLNVTRKSRRERERGGGKKSWGGWKKTHRKTLGHVTCMYACHTPLYVCTSVCLVYFQRWRLLELQTIPHTCKKRSRFFNLKRFKSALPSL